MKQKLIVAIRAISITKASARTVNVSVIISKCSYNRDAYTLVCSPSVLWADLKPSTRI